MALGLALSTCHSMPQLNCYGSPDFLFMHCALAQATACYARTLLRLRWAAQSSGSEALQLHEAAELALRSVKSTVLANAAQLILPKKQRVSHETP